MNCKHCGRDSEEETHVERTARYFHEALAKSVADPVGFRAQQMAVYNDAITRGCSFANYEPNSIAVFEPRGGGSYGHIYGDLANEIGKRWQPERYASINATTIRARGSLPADTHG